MEPLHTDYTPEADDLNRQMTDRERQDFIDFMRSARLTPFVYDTDGTLVPVNQPLPKDQINIPGDDFKS